MLLLLNLRKEERETRRVRSSRTPVEVSSIKVQEDLRRFFSFSLGLKKGQTRQGGETDLSF